MPALGLYARLAIGLAAVLLLAGATWLVLHSVQNIYDSGHEAGVAETKAEQLQALVASQNAVIELNKQLAERNLAYASLEADALLQAGQAPATVTRIIRENPEFQCRRPPELAAQRLSELKAVAVAAGGGADGGVPVVGVPAVPAAPDR